MSIKERVQNSAKTSLSEILRLRNLTNPTQRKKPRKNSNREETV
jgi:hypothetical protein